MSFKDLHAKSRQHGSYGRYGVPFWHCGGGQLGGLRRAIAIAGVGLSKIVDSLIDNLYCSRLSDLGCAVNDKTRFGTVVGREVPHLCAKLGGKSARTDGNVPSARNASAGDRLAMFRKIRNRKRPRRLLALSIIRVARHFGTLQLELHSSILAAPFERQTASSPRARKLEPSHKSSRVVTPACLRGGSPRLFLTLGGVAEVRTRSSLRDLNHFFHSSQRCRAGLSCFVPPESVS